MRWYNDEHRHSAIRFVTPSQRHVKKDVALPARRQQIYERARAQHPRRWSGPTRNREPVGELWQNHDQDATSLEAA